MAKVLLDIDEWYPCATVKYNPSEDAYEADVYEIDDETLERWKEVDDAFWKVQKEKMAVMAERYPRVKRYI